MYGADAVAGVVNILLRKEYEGFTTTARIGGSTDGGNFQQQFSVLSGTKWSTGGILAVYDYRSEEHTSELQSLMRISYAVFCLNKKKNLISKTKLTSNFS